MQRRIMKEVNYLVGNSKFSLEPFEPFSRDVCNFLNNLSDELNSAKNIKNYPDLKASENFNQIQRSLNEVEEQISASRRSYNATVTSYNNSVEMFPTNILAGMMNMKHKKVFEIPEIQRENVNVGDLFDS